MKKVLTMIAVVAVVFAFSVPTFAATENLNFGGQAEFDGVYLFKDKAADTHFAQSEIYLWASADLADNVMAKINIKYKNLFGGTPSGIFDGYTANAGDLVLQDHGVLLEDGVSERAVLIPPIQMHRGEDGAYSFFHSGFRFSRKAFNPSWASWVSINSWI